MAKTKQSKERCESGYYDTLEGASIKSSRTRINGKLVRARDKVFADEFVRNGGIGEAAARKAYPNVNHSNKGAMKKRALKMLNKPHVQMWVKEMEMRVIAEAGPSIEKIAEMRDGGSTERIQLEAAKTLLGAYDGAMNRREKQQDREVNKNITNNVLIMSDNELIERVNRLKGKVIDA